MPPAIIAEGLTKRYGSVVALDGLDLEVAEGTVMGMLGPNGAGKTTTVQILTTLLDADGGKAQVAGLDVATQAAELRTRIGLSGQYAAVDENLTGFENLDMVGRLYHLGRQAARARARELLAQFDLEDSADRQVKGYSGGMRRRLDLAAALVARPPVIFLDEPTTGLDPRSRIDLWQVISDLVKEGATLLLTTHFLDEADLLSDSIAVIDHGRVIARGTADELKEMIGGERVEVGVATDDELTVAAEVMTAIGTAELTLDRETRRIALPVSGGTDALVRTVRALDGRGIAPIDLVLRRPTLDDVFLALTGHAAEEEVTT
jgi:ABC-2 type transport system ATP-binding protein